MALSAAPAVISRYFALDAERDVDGVTALFAADATVVDERETHHGRAAIRAWRAGPASRYEYTTEVLRTEPAGPDRYIVTARLTGNFPGNTVDLRHDFTIASEDIARLVITP
jgi:ketosteroid isomerase-like protein